MEGKRESLVTRRSFLIGAATIPISHILKGCVDNPIDKVFREARLRCEKGLQSPRNPIQLKFINQTNAGDDALKGFEYAADTQNADYHRGIRSEHPQQLTDGPETYTISEITASDIVSQDFRDCIGSVFVGTHKEHGAQVAFLVHADPTKILGEHQGNFVRDFNQRMREFLELIEPESVAYTFFGGKYRHETYGKNRDRNDPITTHDDDYLSVMHVRALVMQAELALNLVPGISPTALIGPNVNRGATHVRFRSNGESNRGRRELMVLAEHEPSEGYAICSLRDYLSQLEKRLP